MQTGSGKTYTMGTGSKDGSQTGLIPQVMNALFSKIETLKHQTEFQLQVSFIEVYILYGPFFYFPLIDKPRSTWFKGFVFFFFIMLWDYTSRTYAIGHRDEIYVYISRNLFLKLWICYSKANLIKKSHLKNCGRIESTSLVKSLVLSRGTISAINFYIQRN